jgi:site-specific recombinase
MSTTRTTTTNLTPDAVLERILTQAEAHIPSEAPMLAGLVHGVLMATGNRAKANDTCVALIIWLLDGDSPDFPRLSALVAMIEDDAVICRRLRDALAALTAGPDVAHLFTVVGMPHERGFLAEAMDRIAIRWLPRPRQHDMVDLLRRIVAHPATAQRFHRIPPDLMRRLVSALAGDGWAALGASFADGFRLIAIRVRAQGLSPILLPCMPPAGLTASPFYRCTDAALRLADAWMDGAAVDEAVMAWRVERRACRDAIDEIRARLETEGVSVDAVFALDVLERGIFRLDAMADLMNTIDPTEYAEGVRSLVEGLARAAHQDRSLRHLAGTNLRLLHRRIIERSASTGEHYIANDRQAYRMIWFEAAGGGLLTVLTASIKTAVSQLHHAVAIAPLPIGFLYGLNYAASFIALQHFGLILATKQPAMTAAALSTAIVRRDRDNGDDVDHDLIVQTCTRIIQSQLAAAVANVTMVAAGCFAFDQLWHLATGHHWLAAEAASHIYADLSPTNSLTVFYAALTGVILWMSSLVGGWLDNWSVRHRIHDGIAEHALGERWGRARLVRWGTAWRKHIAGWGTNISLGMMLGFTPVIGEIIGIPLDVRHVTLSTGTLSLACAGMGSEWWNGGFFLLALWGIAVMFVLNLGVSFSLSLYTALRAYELAPGELMAIVGLMFKRVITRPFDLIFPRGLPAAPPATT